MNLPKAFEERMKALLGSEYEAYRSSYGDPRVYGLRVNTGKITAEEFLSITPFNLEPIPWMEHGFYYNPDDPVTKHPHYYAGLYYVQEPSAMIPADRLPVEPGDCVLDLCAAPGGKATELGAKLKGRGLLVANDISNSRAKGLLKNLELFGIGNLLVTSEEPGKLASCFGHFFDKILIDAPCSGEGMFRKEPGMVRSWMEHGPEYYAGIQRQILQDAVKMLKPGGMLLYSTCTFSEEENEGSIRYLMELLPELHTVPMKGYHGFAEGNIVNAIRVFPQRVRGEGHFAALLKWDREPEVRSRERSRKEKELAYPKEMEVFLNQISSFKAEDWHLEMQQERMYLLPEEALHKRGLRYLRTGLYAGDLKKGRFEPSQALAMYLKLADYPFRLSLNSGDERTVRYLKGETLELAGQEEGSLKGWVLVGVDGYPLGWGKVVNGTLRNKYYPGWRLQ